MVLLNWPLKIMPRFKSIRPTRFLKYKPLRVKASFVIYRLMSKMYISNISKNRMLWAHVSADNFHITMDTETREVV